MVAEAEAEVVKEVENQQLRQHQHQCPEWECRECREWECLEWVCREVDAACRNQLVLPLLTHAVDSNSKCVPHQIHAVHLNKCQCR